MRARLVTVLCLVVAAVGVSAVAPTSILAKKSAVPIPVTILYTGSYDYQETAVRAGATISYINQKFAWGWKASGSVPISFNGSATYGVENLRGELVASGASSGNGSDCTYSAGSGGSTPIRVSVLDEHGTMQVGYGLGIPGAAATCDGETASPTDVLDCDFSSCEAGICPGAPPAVSTDRSQTDVLTAFQPTTSYLKAGYVDLTETHGADLDWKQNDYDLPPATGSFRTTCQSNPAIGESAKISITSHVLVTLNSVKDLDVDFPGKLPPTPLTDLIALDPDRPSNPSISIPPDSPQLPDYPGLDELSPNLVSKQSTTSGANPAVGVITVRCPHQDQRCDGTFSVTATGGAPRGVLGRRSYSVPGGVDEILNVPLGSSAGAVLNRAGRLPLRVSVTSDVTPGSRHASGHRTVLLTKSLTFPGIPSG